MKRLTFVAVFSLFLACATTRSERELDANRSDCITKCTLGSSAANQPQIVGTRNSYSACEQRCWNEYRAAKAKADAK